MKKFIIAGSEKIKVSHFLILIVILLLFIFIFFGYNQQQKKIQLYATAVMGASGDIFLAAPYWVADSINPGDSDRSVLGTVNSEVLNKISYEGGSHGKHVILQLKFNAIKDKNGLYYYKNQPLLVNNWLDLKLGNINEKVYIIYLDTISPERTTRIVRVTLKKENEYPYIADNLAIGDEMESDQGEIMVKIINKSIAPALVRSNSTTGEVKFLTDNTRDDIILTVDILATRKGDLDFFGEVKKIRIGEKLNLFFRKATLWDGLIIDVNYLKENQIKPGDSNTIKS